MNTSARSRLTLLPAAFGALLLAAAVAMGCYSPMDSQKYFAQAGAKDPALELLHRTALYSVFYDHALRRCVLHSAHTWGESGGGGGGTGVGVYAFRCDPARIKERVKLLNLQIEDIKDPGETPEWEKMKQQEMKKKEAMEKKPPPPATPVKNAPETPKEPVEEEPYGDPQ
jgi:hypothetical protein